MWPRWGNGEIRAHLNGADGNGLLVLTRRRGQMADRAVQRGDQRGLLRQGDVLLVPVDGVPEDGSTTESRGSHHVLAEGEATGHAHVVAGRSRLVEWRRPRRYAAPLTRRFLVVEQPALLSHEEHLPIDLDPGVYEVRRQREYRPHRSVWVGD